MRFAFGEYQLDTQTRTLERRGKRIAVEAKVFDLLAYLVEHRDRVVSADELLDTLWSGVSVTPAALSRTVGKARRAVGDDGEHQAALRTEHGRGFRFVAKVSVVPVLGADEGSAAGHPQIRRKRAAALLLVAILVAAALFWVNRRASAPLAAEPSIAVLPFANMSGDPEQEYFSDGMTEALISNLAKIGALRVISRTSAMHYKDTRKTLPEIAEELNVDALVEGSVTRLGDRVRITVQLIDGTSDRHLWTEEYERDLEDVLLLQSELAQAIAREIRVAVTPEDEERLASARVVDPDAFKLAIKGDYYLDRQEFERATDLINKAIAIDPNYAEAYALLSYSYSLRATWGRDDPAQVLPQAKTAVLKALELDDSLPVAHRALAEIAMAERDWTKAEETFKRAIELDPSSSWGHHNYSGLLLRLGRLDEAVAEAFRAQQLNPVDDLINAKVVTVLRTASRYEEAIQEGRSALALNPNFRLVRGELVWTYIQAGRIQEAIAEARDYVNRTERSADSVWALSWALFRAGSEDEAIELQRSNVEANSDYAPTYHQMGFLYTYAGQMDQALHSYKQLFALFPGSWFYMRIVRFYLTLGDAESAARWLEHSGGVNLDRTHALATRYLLQRYQSADEEALATARLLGASAERPSLYAPGSHLIWLRDLQQVDPRGALQVYARLYPELLESPPFVRRDNYEAAVSLAWLRLQTGDKQSGEALLRDGITVMKRLRATVGGGNRGFCDVMAQTLQGNKEEAMAALERQLEPGWRLDWWILRVEPVFELLWDLPEFQQLMAELEAEMAQQLANLREMERTRELAATPRNEANLH